MDKKHNNCIIPVKKVRSSNLELYRIIVMLLIVMHHYVVNSGLMNIMEASPLSSKSIFLYLCGMWGKIGINCFVLITGYFMCKSEITLWKFLKLLLEIEFYNISIYLVFVVFGYVDFSIKTFLWTVMPIKSISDGFTSCYLAFFLFIPFLNVLVNNISKKQHQLLLFLLLSIYSILYFLPYIRVIYNYVTWFCILFIIGSYLRLYPLNAKSNLFWMNWLLISILVSIFSVLFVVWLKTKGYHLGAFVFVSDSNAPLAVIVSVCALMFFKTLQIRQSNVINIIGGGTFGVLLIHANSDTMRQWLWKDVFNNVGQYASNRIFIHAILVPLLVFSICSLIEYIRMKTIEMPLLGFTYKTICNYFPNAK